MGDDVARREPPVGVVDVVRPKDSPRGEDRGDGPPAITGVRHLQGGIDTVTGEPVRLLPPTPLRCWPCYADGLNVDAFTIVNGTALCIAHANAVRDTVPRPPRPKRERQPDPVFDALADLHGGTANLTPPMAKSVGVALATIRKATPDVTPDEVFARALNYRHLSWNREHVHATAWALAKWWGECAGSNQPPDRYQGSATIDTMTPDEIRGATNGG